MNNTTDRGVKEGFVPESAFVDAPSSATTDAAWTVGQLVCTLQQLAEWVREAQDHNGDPRGKIDIGDVDDNLLDVAARRIRWLDELVRQQRAALARQSYPEGHREETVAAWLTSRGYTVETPTPDKARHVASPQGNSGMPENVDHVLGEPK